MPALLPTGFSGKVVFLGQVADRNAGLTSAPLSEAVAGFAGLAGDAHGGLTRPSCSRVLAQYKRDTEIRNTRQFSVMSAEDLAAIAAAMGLASLDPALVGASIVIAGIPDFSHIPPSSRLQFDGGATLVVDLENRPCQLPAKPIEAAAPGHGKAFRQAARNRRGVTAWVEGEGILRLGQTVTLHIPDQPAWAHLDAARGATHRPRA